MSQRLKILLIGATGVLGRAVAAELVARHDIVTAGSKSGLIRIDIADPKSIEAGLDAAGALDAVVSAAGSVANPLMSPPSASGQARTCVTACPDWYDHIGSRA